MTSLSRIISPIVYINWGHGTDADTTPYNDVTNDALRGTLKVGWGRDQARSTAPAKTEFMECVLNNQRGTYNNAAGPIAGFVNRGPDVAVYLQHTSGVTVDSLDVTLDDETWTLDDPESVTMFRGFIEQAPQTIASLKSVSVSALGILRQFTNRRVTIPLMENTRVDLILHAICDELGIDNALRFFDEGDVVIDNFWMGNELALPMLIKLIATEGPNAAIFTNNRAELHFQGNQYRTNNYRSNTIQWYLYDTLEESAPFRNPILHSPTTSFNQDPNEVYNVVTTRTNIREVDTVVGQKWSYGQALVIPGAVTVTIYATFSNPVKEAVTPTVTTDFLVSSGAITSISIDHTSGTRIGITITADSSGAVITGPAGQESDGIFIRAKELTIHATPTIESTVDTEDSKARYLENPLALDIWPEINPNLAQDAVNAVARRYQIPRDQLTLNIYSRSVDEALFILRAQISDRIHVSVASQGIDSDYFIEQIDIQSQGNGLFLCTIGCELAIDEDAFRFGIDTFGNNVFG